MTRFFSLLAALAVAVVGAEFYLRSIYFQRYGAADRNCLYPEAGTASLRFAANCHMTVTYPDGFKYTVDTNQNGLRDRSLAEFTNGSVYLLGSSLVEGIRLPFENTLGHEIERQGADIVDSKVLSMGIRGLGMQEQVDYIHEVIPRVPLRGLIWIINESDLADDLLNKARLDPRESANELRDELAFFNGSVPRPTSKPYLISFLAHAADLALAQRQLSTEAAAAYMCQNVVDGWSSVPVWTNSVIVAIPHGRIGAEATYYGVGIDRKAFSDALSCIRRHNITVFDLRKEYDDLHPYFFAGENYLNSEGTRRFADLILNRMREKGISLKQNRK